MATIDGLTGYRPIETEVANFTAPPYDVVKEGSPLEKLLSENQNSLFHITLGEKPGEALQRFIKAGIIQEDKEPCYYVYEQKWKDGSRLGFFAGVAVEDYASGNIIRHEKTFDEKVKGRIAVTNETQLTLEPIFLLTRSPIQTILEKIIVSESALYSFTTDFKGLSELHGIKNRIFKLPAESPAGKQLKASIAQNPLYIADGHHRYHAALLNKQNYAMAYIVEKATILAYNRLINGKQNFSDLIGQLSLEKCQNFTTPPKHQFCIYTKEGCYILKAKQVPDDVVGRLDCSILEKELYPLLGVNHSMITQKKFFEYYAESELETMKQKVDEGHYNMAIALHPVSIDELMAVANAGMKNSEIVMPEKSTFFAPKILSGIILNQHKRIV